MQHLDGAGLLRYVRNLSPVTLKIGELEINSYFRAYSSVFIDRSRATESQPSLSFLKIYPSKNINKNRYNKG